MFMQLKHYDEMNRLPPHIYEAVREKENNFGLISTNSNTNTFCTVAKTPPPGFINESSFLILWMASTYISFSLSLSLALNHLTSPSWHVSFPRKHNCKNTQSLTNFFSLSRMYVWMLMICHTKDARFSISANATNPQYLNSISWFSEMLNS